MKVRKEDPMIYVYGAIGLLASMAVFLLFFAGASRLEEPKR